MAREHWNELTKNINKLNKAAARQGELTGKQYAGLNQEWLSQKYDVVFAREKIKKGVWVNRMRTAKEVREKGGKEAVKEFMKQRREFKNWATGGEKKYFSSTYEDAVELSRYAYEQRSEDIETKQIKNGYDSDFADIYKNYAREWESSEWELANKLMKEGVNSDTAIELAYALLNENYDMIKDLHNTIQEPARSNIRKIVQSYDYYDDPDFSRDDYELGRNIERIREDRFDL